MNGQDRHGEALMSGGPHLSKVLEIDFKGAHLVVWNLSFLFHFEKDFVKCVLFTFLSFPSFCLSMKCLMSLLKELGGKKGGGTTLSLGL